MNRCEKLSYWCIRLERRLSVARQAYTWKVMHQLHLRKQGSCNSVVTLLWSGRGSELQPMVEYPLWLSDVLLRVL
jgi:hypothetical protein